MSTEIDRATTALFSQGGQSAGNVKFFPGLKRTATAEQFAEQLNRADAQVRAGLAVPSKELEGDIAIKHA